MTKIQRVEQRGRYDCGVACLAMVTGASLDNIEHVQLQRKVGELIDPNPPASTDDPTIGVSVYEMCPILWDFDIDHLHLTCFDDTGENWISRVQRQLPAFNPIDRTVQHVNLGGIAILGVPSLHHPDGEHWIVADGPTLHDPARREPRYASFHDYNAENMLRLFDVILIR